MDGGVKSYPVLTDKGGEFRTTSPKGATLLFNSVMMTNGGRYGSAWRSDWASLLVVDVTK
ncbi:hypothetical protein [Sulfitobacter sp. MF3-043]|uniref:hypothetical protein n=1 Tax=Sulfitobacter sediminivivens TaxID=3252902 RepID=UPI003EB70FAE